MTEFQPVAFGEYALLERIAVGPIAEIYRASGPDGQGNLRPVFIKRLLPHLTKNRQLVDTLTKAARISSHLAHENIARVFDFGTTDATFYLAAEYLAGHSLHELIEASKEKGQPIGLENALYIAAEICRGLTYAHGFIDPAGNHTSVIHGNLSPQAVFLTSDGRVKLTDFGIHTDNGQDRTAQLDMMKGKLAYMSPEQVGGNAVDHRTDIFTLGLLLYEMVTGKQTFQGKTMEVFSMVRQAHFEPAENIAKGVCPKVCEIIHRTLEKDPNKRYPSAGAMAEDLQKALSGTSVRPTAQGLSSFLNTLFGEKTRTEERGQILGSTMVPKQKQQTSIPSTTGPKPASRPVAARKKAAEKLKTEGSFSSAQTETHDHGYREQERVIAPKKSASRTRWLVVLPVTLVAVLVVAVVFQRDFLTERFGLGRSPIVETAIKALETRNFHQAVLLFEEALAAAPDTHDEIARPYARALEGRAACLLKTNPLRAEKLLLTAKQFDPKSTQVHAQLGLLYLNCKDYDKAIAAYEEAISLDPQLVDVFFNLGYVYAITKDYLKAQEMYGHAVKLAPPFLDEALFNLAVVQVQVGKRQESLDNLRRAIQINPKNKQAKQYLQTLTS